VLAEIIPFVSQGYAVASLDYRFTTTLNNPAVLPAQIQDARCALSWLKVNAPAYGYSASHVVVMGDSAGGHLAGMVAMNLPYGTGFDDSAHCSSNSEDSTVASAVLFYPAIDLRATTDLTSSPISGIGCTSGQDCVIKALGGTPESLPTLAASVSPISYLGSSTVPVMIAQGASDEIINLEPIHNFVDTMISLNRPMTYVELPGIGHGFIGDSANFWAGNSPYAPALCSMLNFVQKTSGGN
jgi:acetyl esterase/lipase